jgi:hypothetical protein
MKGNSLQGKREHKLHGSLRLTNKDLVFAEYLILAALS